jgi:Carboxypeptidase regulatory-like domain
MRNALAVPGCCALVLLTPVAAASSPADSPIDSSPERCGTVQIVDSRGRPISGAELTRSDCSVGDDRCATGPRRWLTDRRGRVCASQLLQPGGSLEITAPDRLGGACAGSRRLFPYTPPTRPGKQSRNARLVLEVADLPRMRLRGRVLSRERHPIPGATIVVGSVAVSRDCSYVPDLSPRTSDSNGAFVFPLVPAGQVTVGVRHPAYAPRTVEVTDPSHEQIIEMQPGFVWKGKVRLPGGAPLEDCRIQLEIRSEPVATSRCTPEGFSLEHLPAGDAGVVVASGETSPLGGRTLRQPVHIAEVDSQGDIIWPEGVRVEGQVAGTDGRPIPGALLVAVSKERRASQPEVKVVADTQGHFSLRDLPRGMWRLTADIRSSSRATVEVDAHADRDGVRLIVASPAKER